VPIDDGAGRRRAVPMGFLELTMTDVREVLRRWQSGQSAREIARNGVADRKTAGRYIEAARGCGLASDSELIGCVLAPGSPLRRSRPMTLRSLGAIASTATSDAGSTSYCASTVSPWAGARMHRDAVSHHDCPRLAPPQRVLPYAMFMMPIWVFTMPIPLFTIRRSWRSRCADPRVHDRAKCA
jgi:hypothetical protein